MAVEHWYISDHHLYHWNIIEYGKRPFKTLSEMHDTLVEKHNAVVKPQDHVSFLGDVTMLRGGKNTKNMFLNELQRYNGHKRLYLGNHDHWKANFYLNAGFEKVYATWRCDDGFVCSHIPLHPRSLSTATANVHGHIHQAPVYEPVVFKEWIKDSGKVIPAKVVPYINVSVEVVNYTPVNKCEILAIIKKHNTSYNESNIDIGADIKGGGAV